jgi:hypothetical protein
MLVLAETGNSFPDNTDPSVRYHLPGGLAPVSAPGRLPEVTLSRGQGTGLLHLRLAPTWPALGPGEKRVSFSRGRFRLLMTTSSSTERGEWHPTRVSEEALVDSSVSLNAAEAAMARRLGEGGGEVVEVEVELEISGFAPTFPWLAECDGELVRRTVATLLGSAPVVWEKVEAAFLGLGMELFQWHPLEPAALPFPRDAALRAIAHHAKPFLLEGSNKGWQVRSSAPPRLTLSLAVPYLQSRAIGMRWSFSDFIKSQPDPKRHLIDIVVPAPLEAARLLVVNDVPLAEGGIQRIEVEVRTGGPSGRVNTVFLPGQPSVAHLTFVRETFEDLDLTWRAKVTVNTAKGPAVVETPDAKTGMTLDLSPQKIGLTPLRFFVTREVFAHVASIEIAVGARPLTLTADKPEGWVVGRTPPLTCPVVAVIASGQKISLGEFPIAGGLTVDAAMLGVGELASVVFRTPVDVATRAAYIALQVENGPWRTLDPGTDLSWQVRRGSRVEPARLRYRTRHVPRLATGTTGPIIESTWKMAEGPTAQVEI